MISQNVAPRQPRGSKSTTRWDIQALRGWAIALVIIDHAKLPVFKGGFLGVDIFFVVSGFLMTGLILRAIDAGTFSLRDFYSRRARRLLPAAYSTIVVTAMIAPFLLDPHEFGDFVAQTIGSFTFTVNYVLWAQIDYFNNLAALKPLLHMWSLSLEEQYYLVIPILLMVCAKAYRLPVSIVLTAASLGLCYYLAQHSPSAAFYFLPTRAWELGLGSISAIVAGRWQLDVGKIPATALRWLCLAVLLVVPIIFDAVGHPGPAAVLVCLATAWLMASPTSLPATGLSALPVWIGDRSYSLYLLHWPLFAFANNLFVHEPDIGTRLSLVAACFLAAELQYRAVEVRYRHRPLSGRYLTVLAVIPVIVVGSLYAIQSTQADNANDFRTPNEGLASTCNYTDEFIPRPECQASSHPGVLVWGDSFAMHNVQAVVAGTSQGVIQATQFVCGPFLGVAPVNGELYKNAWAMSCIAFNDSVMQYVEEHPEITTVVLSSAFSQYLPGGPEQWRLVNRTGDDVESETALKASISDTVGKLRALNRKVVLYAPPPAYNFDLGRCLQRKIEGYMMLPPGVSCDFKRADFEAYKAYIRNFVADIEKSIPLTVVRFDDILCDTVTCHGMIDGVPIYRDDAHLSITGSKLLGQKLRLDDVLIREKNE